MVDMKLNECYFIVVSLLGSSLWFRKCCSLLLFFLCIKVLFLNSVSSGIFKVQECEISPAHIIATTA